MNCPFQKKHICARCSRFQFEMKNKFVPQLPFWEKVVNELVNLEYVEKLNKKRVQVFEEESGKAEEAVVQVERKMRIWVRCPRMNGCFLKCTD